MRRSGRRGASIAPDFDQNLTVAVAGPGFHDLDVGEEPLYLLAGYVDAPSAVDVRASYGTASVDGRSAGPNGVVDGVFVLMPVTELDDAVDFEAGYSDNWIQLDIIRPSE